jgi:hypothetical protein
MWHPRIAAVGVVLHDDEPAARPKVAGERPDRLGLTAARDEVEAVGGNQAIERWQRQGTPEVADERLDGDVRERSGNGLRRLAKHARVSVHCDDPSARAEQVRESERERAGPGTDVRPRATGFDAGSQ